MNKRNFNRLIARIKKLEHFKSGYLPEGPDEKHFTMSSYRYNCGAPACIAGHGAALFAGHVTTAMMDTAATAEGLGIEEDWAREPLFIPSFMLMKTRDTWKQTNPIYLDNITPEEACIALSRVKAAGKNYKKLSLDDIWGGLRT